MSSPVSTAAAAVGAAKLAQGIMRSVANGVGEAMGFHDVLRQDTPSDAPKVTKQNLIDSVRNRLKSADVGVNHPIEISLSERGQIQVEGNHPHGATIESLLNQDASISMLASKLASQLDGPTRMSIGLTTSSAEVNILASSEVRSSSGGYPNW